ncbi:MAG: hypothetical protein IPK26_02615 [Planctomycetes bacterium]|nr:hypothetical protein [Planctomycetota bacterium]
MSGLPPALGGVGGDDLVAFTYDRATDSVTLNASAAGLNTAADEFALNFAPDAGYAVFERIGQGMLQVAVSPQTGAFLTPVPIQNGPAPTQGLDPSPGRIDGRSVLFFNRGSHVAWQEHDLAGAALVGPITDVAVPSVPGGNCHSAWPVAGVDGESEALLVCQGTPTNISHWLWAGDLRAITPALPQDVTTNRWDNNGCLAGGRIYMVRSSTSTNAVMEYDVAITLGDVVLCQGDYAETTVLAPPRPGAAAPDISFVFAGFQYLPAPVSYPGIAGALGLGGSLIHMGTAEHEPGTGIAMVPFLMPMALGGSFGVQALTISPTANLMALGSTAAIELRGGAGTRTTDAIPGPVNVEDLEVLDGEPMERLFLPQTHGAIQSVAFAAPNDPGNAWVPDRDYAAVIRPDGTAFVDIRRAGGFVVQITTATDVVKKFFVKSKKLKFTAGAVAAFKQAPPAPLPGQYAMPLILRERPDAGDNGYAAGLRAFFPLAPEFGSVGELARLIVAWHAAQPVPQPIDVLICAHGIPGGFQMNTNSYVQGTWVFDPLRPLQPPVMTLNAEALALLGGGVDAQGAFLGIRGKVRRMVIFACMVACPQTTNVGPAFLGEFTSELAIGNPIGAGQTSVTAWDVCSYMVPPSRTWSGGGFGRVVVYPPWLGIAGGRQPLVTTR